MAAERECVCCKNLPRWNASGVTRTCNFGHWTGGSPGSGSYLRNWHSDGVWGPSLFHVLSNRDYMFAVNAGGTEYYQYRTGWVELLQTSPTVTATGGGAPCLFDNKLHIIGDLYISPAGNIGPVTAYCTIWDLSDNTIEMDSKEIISFKLDGVEMFPLGDPDFDDPETVGRTMQLKYAIAKESNSMFLQVATHVSNDNASYRSYIGTFDINSLSSTECEIDFTSSASSSAVTLNNYLSMSPKIAEAFDGTLYYADSIFGNSRFVSIPGFSYSSTTATTTTFNFAGRCGCVSSWKRPSGGDYTFYTVAPDGSYSFTITNANMGAFDFSMRSVPGSGDATGRTPAMMAGTWCINAKPTLTLANSTFPDLDVPFDSDDTEPDGDVDLTKFVFNHDFTIVARRMPWNWGPVESGGNYVPGSDGFEATSPFHYLVATLPAHETELEQRFEDASNGFLTVPEEQAGLLVQWDAGIDGFPPLSTPHENHYDLSGSTAEFEIRFIEQMKTSAIGSAMFYHEVNELTEDMILVLATGTVTHDPIDPSDITTSDNKTWSVTVNNVAGGTDGGILSLTLRADMELYGAPEDEVYGNLPPRVPAVYQEFYDVPADTP